jgi:error-prone DNA polymerase
VFARRLYAQIQGFGEYGFPESHAASFALLVYASAWLKCHHPAAFLCALLNSQPMGFYSASTLVQDARRHGIEVRPPDVSASERDCTLEQQADGRYAVRLGLREIRGLSAEAAERIAQARHTTPFGDLAALAAGARLSGHDLACLAAGDALAGLAGHRRQAAWQAAAAAPRDDLLAGGPSAETMPMIAAPSEGENLVADYRHLGLTLRRHPLALLRPQLMRRRLLTAADIGAAPDRQLARAAGIVTCRQRPGTANGIVFVTLEDETGWINVVVHGWLVERQRRQLLAARLLAVYGQVQREGEVVHLVARRLLDCTPLLGTLPTVSRDFG